MITSLYAALIGILLIILSFNVVIRRAHTKVEIGHGDNDYLLKAIRAQANLIEYAPISLILLFLTELNGASFILLNFSGVVLVVARILHAIGLYRHSGRSFSRFLGTNLTWLVILTLSIWNLIYGIQELIA